MAHPEAPVQEGGTAIARFMSAGLRKGTGLREGQPCRLDESLCKCAGGQSSWLASHLWGSGPHLLLFWVLGGGQVVSFISIFQMGKLRPKRAHLAQGHGRARAESGHSV